MEAQRIQQPFHDGRHTCFWPSGSGFVLLGPVVAAIAFWSMAGTAMARDGATEALELRYHAELAIAEESAGGHSELAGVMRNILSGMLVEHLVARDETVTLDMVDAAFVAAQFDTAAAMEEPGVAMALDVFAGPGTGYEHGIRTSIANLAGFSVGKAGYVSESALDAHERVIAHHMSKLEALDETTIDRIDDAVAEAAEAAVEAAAEAAEATVEATVEAAEDVVEAAEAADEAAEEAAEEEAEVEEEEVEVEPDE